MAYGFTSAHKRRNWGSWLPKTEVTSQIPKGFVRNLVHGRRAQVEEIYGLQLAGRSSDWPSKIRFASRMAGFACATQDQ